MSHIPQNTQKILEECQKKNARLCIASKTQTIEDLQIANISPEIIFAENKVQEAEEKFSYYSSIPNKLHLIGPLQKNKVRKAVKIFDMIQSVDSLALLRKIDEVCGEEEKMIEVLLNINISDDPKKTGLRIDELVFFIQRLSQNPHKSIIITGVFTILQNGLSDEDISGYYRLLKKVFDTLKNKMGPQWTKISMGMSNDYTIALEQGSTMVRVGSGIFGSRTELQK